MKNVVQFPDNTALKNVAAQWLVKLDRGELSPEDRKALNDWLAGGAEHKVTLLKMASLWGEMDVAKVLAELFPLPEEAPVQSTSTTASGVEARKCPRAKKSMKMLAAATVALAVGIAFIAAPVLVERATEGSHEVAEKLYTTSLGEHTVIELADGSQMNLNTQSRARVRFSDGERAIYLEQGEAYFDVAKNAERPFVVYAGSGMVRAIGTAFSVRLNADSAVDVTLAEGVVEVVTTDRKPDIPQRDSEIRSQQEPLESTVLKQKGETVSYRQSIDEQILIPEDKLEQRLAWKSGKWSFKGETLAEVIAEASRYTDKEIRITDPSIEGLQVAGYFDLGELEPLLEAVEMGLGVAVNHRDEGVIELSAQRNASSVLQ